MAKHNIKTKDGFTIIEVVLVLAIAGLIFLMVFIAWPALQRSQRDTQRRNDYSMLSTAISNFATNNNGRLRTLYPGSGGDQSCLEINPSKYINERGTDPDGFYYNLKVCKSVEMLNNTEGGKLDKELEDAKEDWSNEGVKAGTKVYVVLNADCEGVEDGHAFPKSNDSSRAFAIYAYLEGGTQTFCSASQ